jgi:hypothetical protein
MSEYSDSAIAAPSYSIAPVQSGIAVGCENSRVDDSSSRRREVMKPQTFDGKEPINSFLAHFEVCARFNSWTIEQKVSWLQWALKGRAQQVLWDLPPSQVASYESIVHALRQRFGSEHKTELYKLELRNRKRGSRESLSDLMQDIRRLMVLAYSATTSEMWESVAINAFLEALDDPELALEVRNVVRPHWTQLIEMLCCSKGI